MCYFLLLCSIAEYDFRQTPYIVSPREQVQVTTVAETSLTLGPIVVKKLTVGNSRPEGRWCHGNGGCCNFFLKGNPSSHDCLLNTSCGGGMEGWRINCSHECESGLLSFSLFKQRVRTIDSGEYVFTFSNSINNLSTNVDNVSAANVDVHLAPAALVAIAVVCTFVFVVVGGLLVIVLVGCAVRSSRKGAQRRGELQEELLAEPAVADGLVQVPGG